MDTLFDLPVMDIIAGFIVVLIASFVVMAIIAWKQCKRANRLAAELHDTEIGRRVWAELAQKHLKQVVELRHELAQRPHENS